jgi:dipeptidyl aminopeptidase/acylaminoacyl peptidase
VTDPIAEALDKFVPAFQSVEGDWQAILNAAANPAGDVPADRQTRHPLGRGLQGRRPRRPLQIGRTRPHRPMRLAIVVALLFLLLTGVATATYLLLRSNGKIAVVGRFGSLLAVNSNGLGLHTIARCAPGDLNCTISEAAWSPDGSRIAFVRGRYGGYNESSSTFVYVAAAAGDDARRLARCGLCGEQYGNQLAWSPDGKRIAFIRDATAGGQSLWVVEAEGGEPHRLAKCRTQCRDFQPTWSPNGRLVAFVRATARTPRASGLFTVRSDGSGLTRIASASGHPDWSPDGPRIVFDRSPDSIAVVNADGSHPHTLSAGAPGTGPGEASWSPDGRKLVFFTTPRRPGGFVAEVWTMNSDGSGKQRLYHSGCCVDSWAPPIWSPDGRLIAFAADSAGGTFVLNADGTGLRRLSATTPYSLSWQRSPRR